MTLIVSWNYKGWVVRGGGGVIKKKLDHYFSPLHKNAKQSAQECDTETPIAHVPNCSMSAQTNLTLRFFSIKHDYQLKDKQTDLTLFFL